MNHKVWLLGRSIGVGAHIMGERVTRPRARTADDVPVSGATLTPEWLTAVLCRDVPGAEVTEYEVAGGSVGTATRTALRVRYNDAGRAAGLPEALFAKTTTAFAQRILLGGGKMIDGETRFFRDFRPQVEMEAPIGYWGAADPGSWRSIALMEDIAETRGAEFIEPTARIGRDRMEDLVRNLAKLHRTFWRHPGIADLKDTKEALRAYLAAIDMRKRCEVGLRRADAVIPEALRGNADRLWAGVEKAIALATDELPPTLLHGDPHIGQTYVTAAGRMGYVDWQVVMRGGWAHDFAYTVNSGCDPADRREWDRDLLTAYLDELGAVGGEAPTFDQAWTAYRQQALFAYAAWAFTIGRAVYQPKMQSEETCLTLLERITAAIDDHESLAALEV